MDYQLILTILSSSFAAALFTKLFDYYALKIGFKRDFYKKIIDKRIDAYEKVIDVTTRNMSTYWRISTNNTRESYQHIFSSKENFLIFYQGIAGLSPVRLWLSKELNELIFNLKNLTITSYNALFTNDEDPSDDTVRIHGHTVYEECCGLVDKIIRQCRVDLVTLEDVSKFVEIKKQHFY